MQVNRSYGLLAVCGLLLLAVIAVFGQVVGHGFVNFDDGDYVVENRHVQEGLTGPWLVWAVTGYDAFNWHPLTWLSHTLDYQLYGLKPAGHHLTSLLLHATTAILLFLTLRRMTGALWPSAFVAAVFAIHPLRVESVAWVSERKDVLSGLLFTLTLWFYVRYAERPPSWGRYVLVMASFTLGLMAKPMLVTLPFVLLLLDYWPLGRWQGAGSKEHGARISNLKSQIRDSRSSLSNSLYAPRSLLALVAEKIPMFALAAASCVITFAAQRGAIAPLQERDFSSRIAGATVAYVTYLGKMFYPADLSILYGLPNGPPPTSEVLAAVILLTSISIAVFAIRRKCPFLLFGWLWYLGTLVPVIGLVQVGKQALADRYTYLTQIGLYIAFAWGVANTAASRPYRRGLAVLSALVLAGLIVSAWQQTRYWRDSVTLWSHALACSAETSVAHRCLAQALIGRGQVEEGIAHLQRALEITPDFAEAHNNLGYVLAGQGKIDEAIAHYQRALEAQPDYAEAHYNLGFALAGRGQVDDAISHYRKALETKPEFAEAQYNLGNALDRRGQVAEAISHYRKALEIKPDFAEAHNNLGHALAGRGQVDEAIDHYRKALEVQPDYAKAHNNLGHALAGLGQVDEAIAHYRQALAIQPGYAIAHVNLADVLASHGKPEEALAHYQKALDLASAQNESALADLIRARIKLRQQASPAGNSP